MFFFCYRKKKKKLAILGFINTVLYYLEAISVKLMTYRIQSHTFFYYQTHNLSYNNGSIPQIEIYHKKCQVFCVTTCLIKDKPWRLYVKIDTRRFFFFFFFCSNEVGNLYAFFNLDVGLCSCVSFICLYQNKNIKTTQNCWNYKNC